MKLILTKFIFSVIFPVHSREYRTTDVPRLVLNKLEERGYNVVGVTGLGQTMVWTLFKSRDII